MYRDSSVPRVAGVARLLSQLSATVNTPARLKPITTRNSSQAHGSVTKGNTKVAVALNDEKAANARIWPIRLISGPQRSEPNIRPT